MNLTMARRCVMAITLFGLPACAWAQIPLEEFKKIVGEACKYPPLESHGSKTELSGSVKAGVNGLVRILAGAEGTASGSKTEAVTSGVKQDQLAAALKNGNDCSSAMWLGFKDKITTVSPALAPTPVPGPVPNSRPSSPAPRRISMGAFAIGDTMEKVRGSGVRGQFGTTKDNKTVFTTEMVVPIRNTYGYSNMAGNVSYVFERGIINRIVFFISKPGSCDQQSGVGERWPDALLSETIQEFGEPSQPPSKTSETGPLFGGELAIQDSIDYIFSRDGEQRQVGIMEATNPTNLSRKMCFFVSEFTRG